MKIKIFVCYSLLFVVVENGVAIAIYPDLVQMVPYILHASILEATKKNDKMINDTKLFYEQGKK